MRVLIIDDEDLVRKSLGRAFKSKNHEVFLAEGGLTGLRLWKECEPEIVLLDVLMPDLSGPKLLEANPGSGFVVLMSAYKGEYDTLTAKSLGAHDFISKPFEDIFLTVERLEKAYENYSG